MLSKDYPQLDDKLIFNNLQEAIDNILGDNYIKTKTNSFYKKMSSFYSIRISDHSPFKRTIITLDMIKNSDYQFFNGSLKTGYSIYKNHLPNYEYYLDLRWSKIKNPIKNKPRLILLENKGVYMIKL